MAERSLSPPERTVHMAAKALILRAFISLLAQRQITSTHISRKPIARRPMYMNSLMTESQRTPEKSGNKYILSVKRQQWEWLLCDVNWMTGYIFYILRFGLCHTDLVSLLVSTQWSFDTFLPDLHLEKPTQLSTYHVESLISNYSPMIIVL